MKKLYTIIATALIGGQLFAGGIVTNTNQSAQYVRMLSRNASLGIDAVYFNPAGVARLSDGFHLSFSNQTIFQTKTITSTFPTLNNGEYIGDVKAPLFPSFFAAYKKGKVGVSFGFGPNGGGGSAEFSKGLASFEKPVSMLPSILAANEIPTDEYSADIYFNGSSIYWGAQLNFTYEINEKFSVAAGVRMINAKNTYQGHIRDIMINPTFTAIGADGSMMAAPEFFTNMSTYLTGVSNSAYGAAQGMQPLISGGAGGLTFAQAEGAGIIDNATRTQLEGGLLAMGSTQEQIDAMTITTAQATYNGYGMGYANSANEATANAAATSDVEVDATQTGMAFTPIFSAMYSPNDKLDIAVKYELRTALTLTNDTKVDGSGMFKHDSSFRADIPAFLAVGVGYKLSDKFRTQLSFNTYFDKQANWGGREDSVENNMWSVSLGMEYDITEKLTGSIGYSRGNTGVGNGYQTDISYSNSSNTVGFGIQFRPMENLAIDLGALFVMYDDFTVESAANPAIGLPAYKTTYAKSLMDFAIGVTYNF